SAKAAARKLTAEFEKSGALTPETPLREGDGLTLFADARNAGALAGDVPTVAGALKAHLARTTPGDYVALLAFVEMSESHERELQGIRVLIRDGLKVATSLGFGPRYLHSTGQAHKGGANAGVFVQITADDAGDVPVPGHKYTFGVVRAAQPAWARAGRLNRLQDSRAHRRRPAHRGQGGHLGRRDLLRHRPQPAG